eukprot:Gb_14160 [translate_table: standard]
MDLDSVDYTSDSLEGPFPGDCSSLDVEGFGLGPTSFEVIGVDELTRRIWSTPEYLSDLERDFKVVGTPMVERDRLEILPEQFKRSTFGEVGLPVDKHVEFQANGCLWGTLESVKQHNLCKGEQPRSINECRKENNRPRKRKRQYVKRKVSPMKLVLGDDVKLNEVMELSTQMLAGNSLGIFLEADMSFLDTRHMIVAKILVGMDLRDGLADEMVLEKGSYDFTQHLDYQGIPFRCVRCHRYGTWFKNVICPFTKGFGLERIRLEGRRRSKELKDLGQENQVTGDSTVECFNLEPPLQAESGKSLKELVPLKLMLSKDLVSVPRNYVMSSHGLDLSCGFVGLILVYVSESGSFGGLISGWKSKVLSCSNSWAFDYGLGVVLYSLDLDQWVSFDDSLRESTVLEFEANLKKVKYAIVKWGHEKKIKDEKDLASVEVALEDLYLQEMVGYPDVYYKDRKACCEAKRGPRLVLLCNRDEGQYRWLVWKVRRRTRVRLGEDPWVGYGGSFRLSKGVLQCLQERGLFNLSQATNMGLSTVWRKEWKSTNLIGLVDEAMEESEAFVNCFRSSHVRLKDIEDELIWSKNPALGLYTPKVVWIEVGNITGIKDVWGGSTLEERLRKWHGNRYVKYELALPLIIAWGVWIVRNASLFDVEKASRHVIFEEVDKTGAWAYFDGASQDNSQVSGVGVVLYLNDTHIIRERNIEANFLSKEGLQLAPRRW